MGGGSSKADIKTNQIQNLSSNNDKMNKNNIN